MRVILSFVAIFVGISGWIAAASPVPIDDEPLTQSDRLGISIMASVPLLLSCYFLIVPGYNQLSNARNRCHMARSNIDILLERRHDVLDNLIAVTRRYAAHEHDTLINVVKHRNRSGAMADASAGSDSRENYAMRVSAVAEAYPDLKADKAFGRYSQQLRETENSLAHERRTYNQAVLQFNNLRRAFPEFLIACAFGFQEEKFFEASSKKRESPVAGLDFL